MSVTDRRPCICAIDFGLLSSWNPNSKKAVLRERLLCVWLTKGQHLQPHEEYLFYFEICCSRNELNCILRVSFSFWFRKFECFKIMELCELFLLLLKLMSIWLYVNTESHVKQLKFDKYPRLWHYKPFLYFRFSKLQYFNNTLDSFWQPFVAWPWTTMVCVVQSNVVPESRILWPP